MLAAAFVKLAPNPQYATPAHPEWTPSPMTITVNGASAEDHLLMDSGVNVAYLMDFIYDAAGGYAGFQWSGGASGSDGFIRP